MEEGGRGMARKKKQALLFKETDFIHKKNLYKSWGYTVSVFTSLVQLFADFVDHPDASLRASSPLLFSQ